MCRLEIYAMVDKHPKQDPIKKGLRIFDNVFKVDLAHSRVIGSKCFFNIATSVGILRILISFSTQDCSVNCILMLFWAFSAMKSKDKSLKRKKNGVIWAT